MGRKKKIENEKIEQRPIENDIRIDELDGVFNDLKKNEIDENIGGAKSNKSLNRAKILVDEKESNIEVPKKRKVSRGKKDNKTEQKFDINENRNYMSFGEKDDNNVLSEKISNEFVNQNIISYETDDIEVEDLDSLDDEIENGKEIEKAKNGGRKKKEEDKNKKPVSEIKNIRNDSKKESKTEGKKGNIKDNKKEKELKEIKDDKKIKQTKTKKEKEQTFVKDELLKLSNVKSVEQVKKPKRTAIYIGTALVCGLALLLIGIKLISEKIGGVKIKNETETKRQVIYYEDVSNKYVDIGEKDISVRVIETEASKIIESQSQNEMQNTKNNSTEKNKSDKEESTSATKKILVAISDKKENDDKEKESTKSSLDILREQIEDEEKTDSKINDETTKKQIETTKKVEETTKKQTETTKKIEETTKKQTETTKKVEETTKKQTETTKKQTETTKKIEETTKKVEETTKKQTETTKKATSETKKVVVESTDAVSVLSKYTTNIYSYSTYYQYTVDELRAVYSTFETAYGAVKDKIFGESIDFATKGVNGVIYLNYLNAKNFMINYNDNVRQEYSRLGKTAYSDYVKSTNGLTFAIDFKNAKDMGLYYDIPTKCFEPNVELAKNIILKVFKKAKVGFSQNIALTGTLEVLDIECNTKHNPYFDMEDTVGQNPKAMEISKETSFDVVKMLERTKFNYLRYDKKGYVTDIYSLN